MAVRMRMRILLVGAGAAAAELTEGVVQADGVHSE